jgi:thiol-disulfide isomerase/thioredoxin
VTERIDHGRRGFLGAAAMTMAAAHLGVSGIAEATQRTPRELAAIGRAADWLNSPRLTPSSLAGKVVLVDFWTYTCINWLRTLPHRRAWAQKYREGLVVIGVHTPEFEFEKNVDNVRRAVRQMRIDYPVAIDNEYAIWRTFNNQHWPALYLIDARGRIRQHHFGEGEYERSEAAIQRLLAEAGVAAPRIGADLKVSTTNAEVGAPDGRSADLQVGDGVVSVDADGVEAAADWTNLKSPENYLGYERTQNFASRGGAHLNRRRLYAAPVRLALNQWALAGEWTMGREATTLGGPDGRIVCRFHARDLHLVMGPLQPRSSARFRVSIDGQRPDAAHGLDVDEDGNGTVVEQRLYQLIRQPHPIVDRTFAIEFLDAGVETFAFTFG